MFTVTTRYPSDISYWVRGYLGCPSDSHMKHKFWWQVWPSLAHGLVPSGPVPAVFRKCLLSGLTEENLVGASAKLILSWLSTLLTVYNLIKIRVFVRCIDIS